MTENTDPVKFPYEDWPENIPPSHQLVTLYLTLPTYRENVQRMVKLLKEGATAEAFRNHPHPGLQKLGRWHKDRAKSFARAAHRGPHSPELDVWPAIAWHLGPCPLMGRQASVHRIDDLQSYALGALEWADKQVQATEKAADKPGNGCKVKWQGRYITDRQLIDKLKGLGISKTELSVRKFRQNNKDKFPDLDTLHDAMLKKWGAFDAGQAKPFKHLPDFLGDAPLMEGIYPRHQWEGILKVHKALRLAPLEVQRKVALELEADYSKTLARMGKEASGYKDRLETQLQEVQAFIRKVRDRIRDMVTKQAAYLCDLNISANPDKAHHLEPAGFGHYSAAVQSIASQPPKPEILPTWADPKKKIATLEQLAEWRDKAESGDKRAYFRANLPYSQWFEGPALNAMQEEREEHEKQVNQLLADLGM